MSVTSVTSASTTSTTSSSASATLDNAAFLQLLVEQLQNQNPLNPTDSTEFMNQLMNYAGYEQQATTNVKLDSLIELVSGLSSETTTAAS